MGGKVLVAMEKHFGLPSVATNKFWPKLVLEIFNFKSVDNVRRQRMDDGPLLYYI